MPGNAGSCYAGIIAVTALAMVTLLALAGCNGHPETAAPGRPAGSNDETSILEEGGNINLALSEAQKGIGPSIVGDPTGV